jgi:hypothetical protein
MKTEVAKTFEDVELALADGDKVFSAVLGCVGEVMSVSYPDEKGNGMYGFEVCSKSRRQLPVKRHRHIHGFVPTRMQGYSLDLDDAGNYLLTKPI